MLSGSLAITDEAPEWFQRYTRKDDIVILIRDDHEIRSGKLAARSQFGGHNFGHLFGVVDTGQGASDIVGMQY
ncbi:MAG TPA: hypothetical protein VEX68_25750 [Bryobacteraceae bacterium]|nr:hypothetical protein [Bryobacteraceae bacterium]